MSKGAKLLANANAATRARNPSIYGGATQTRNTGTLELILPYPPSVNRMYTERVMKYKTPKRSQKTGRQITHFVAKNKTRKAHEYYDKLAWLFIQSKQNGFSVNSRLKATIHMIPPDARERDTDNILKATFDSLAFAGVFEKDSQISQHELIRYQPKKPGLIMIQLEALTTPEPIWGGLGL